jgi:hypothetical protein
VLARRSRELRQKGCGFAHVAALLAGSPDESMAATCCKSIVVLSMWYRYNSETSIFAATETVREHNHSVRRDRETLCRSYLIVYYTICGT